MNWNEHIHQAELMLREATEDLAVEQTQAGLQKILIRVVMANAHATLAESKKVSK